MRIAKVDSHISVSKKGTSRQSVLNDELWAIESSSKLLSTHQRVHSTCEGEMLVSEGLEQSIPPFGTIIMIQHRRPHGFHLLASIIQDERSSREEKKFIMDEKVSHRASQI